MGRRKKRPQDEPEPLSNIGWRCPHQQLKANPIFKRKPLKFFFNKYCKLAFPTLDKRIEYMWVLTKGLAEDKREELHGILNNDPVLPTNIQCGDHIEFSRHEIIEVLED